MDLIHEKMDKVRARQSSAIEKFLFYLEPLLKDGVLLNALSSHVKMVVSDAKAQAYCNKTIRTWLKKNEHIGVEEIPFISYVYTPLDEIFKKDINSYREAPENRQILRFFTEHSAIPEIQPGMYVTVTGVDRRRDILDLLLPNGNTVRWNSVSSSNSIKDYSFAIYEELVLPLSVGDVVRFRDDLPELCISNGQLLEVTSINSNVVHLLDLQGNKYILDLSDSKNRHLEHEYCSILFDKQFEMYDLTIGCFEKEITDISTQNLFNILKARTLKTMFAFSFDPPLRKSVQLSCPSDIYSMFKSVVADKKSDMKTYVESLIDKFLSGKGHRYSDPSNNYWFLLYSSPGDSKAHALWISSSHYEKITEYCKAKDLRTNRLIFTLVMLDLENENKISIN